MKQDNGNLLEFLDKNNIKFTESVNLQKITYFKSGGTVDVFISPENTDLLSQLIRYLNEVNLEFKILGASTNCIFLDETDINIIVSLRSLKQVKFNLIDEEVYAETGVMLPKLVRKLKDNAVAGFEGLEGIPATLGGAIFMNAGSYGYEISDCLIEVVFMNEDGSISTLSKDNCKFKYRESIFKNTYKNKIIIAAKFKFKFGDKDKIDKKISFYQNHRHKILEYTYPNVGSVFITHDIYKELAKKSFIYKLVLIFMRTFVHRIIRAKTNFLLNQVTFRFFGIKDYLDVVSEKTMNVVVNRHTGTRKIIDYINKMHTLIGRNISIEIEII